MTKLTRRDFTRLAAASGAAAATSSVLGAPAFAQGKGRVVVIGGGAGGGTAAHLIKKGGPQLEVTLVEPYSTYTTCFFSNLYLGGFRSFDSITHNYNGHKKLGVKVVKDRALKIDTAKKTVSLAGGSTLSYDKLVVAPGIDFKYETIAGYDEKVAQQIPHAWKAGSQTQLLKKQLMEMKNGGTFVICPPPNPFRCPPGPYERVSMVANYLKKNKPKSKIIILDAKPKFSKQGLFVEGWKKHYPGMIDVHLSNEIDKFGAAKVDAASRTVSTGEGKAFKADVLNVIPAQKAGIIAITSGLAKGDWCPVDPADFSSTMAKDVHVIGDATIAAPMPKSGFSANSQAKVVANAVLASLAGKRKFPARYRNTCWSLISDNDGVKVGANYSVKDKFAAHEGFISKTGEDAKLRKTTFEESVGWYSAITNEIFAKG